MLDLLRSLFDEVRLVDHQLVRTVDELHADLGATAPRRAVMEYLRRAGPSAVPDIARARLVTRQHVQVIADDLVDAGYAVRVDNPAHRRSPLIALTTEGTDLMRRMHQREDEFLGEHLADIEEAEIVDATRVLAALRRALTEAAAR